MTTRAQAGIGAAVPRVDGPKKLDGTAVYAADHHLPDMAHAYGVFSTTARGRVIDIDTRAARQMPGVIEVLHHGRFPSIYHTPSSMVQENKVDETRLPFEDDGIYYPGQFIALIVAESFVLARDAARHVVVRYDRETPIATLAQAMATDEPKPAAAERQVAGALRRGNFRQQVQQEKYTPPYLGNRYG